MPYVELGNVQSNMSSTPATKSKRLTFGEHVLRTVLRRVRHHVETRKLYGALAYDVTWLALDRVNRPRNRRYTDRRLALQLQPP